MTKKGYQKRLPTVLAVPAPRSAPTRERLAPAAPQPEVRPEPRSTPRPAPAPAPVPAPVPVEKRREPVAPPPRAGTGTSTAKIVAASALGLVVVLVVGARIASMLAGDEPSAPRPAAIFGARPPVLIGPGESYVDVRVVADGDVEATQWIAAAEPLERLRLELPELVGAEDVTARAVTVMADGELVAGPTRITGRDATYVLDSATDVQVSYRLSSALVMSSSVTGRALAAVGMRVAYEPRSHRETRVVNAPGMLSLACGSPTSEGLVPCGKETGTDEWTVDLIGRHVEDSVVAQLTLG